MKFDPDYAIFGTLGGELIEDGYIGDIEITYSNKACIALFKDFRGMSIADVVREVAGTEIEGNVYVDRLVKNRVLAFEGRIAGKFVKFHSRVIDTHADRPDCSCVQAAIMDITDSVTLKHMLYDTSEALKRAARAADEDTGHHVIRINHYARALSELMGKNRGFTADISRFAQLHDIGKIRVANIVRLPRTLTEEEFAAIKLHTKYGAEIVADLEGLEMAYNIALDHHEKWDGSGYPSGKSGNEISIEGRITAIADIFDALVSERPYKKAFSYDKALQIIKNGDGRVMPNHFDPEIHRHFIGNYTQFVELHKEFK